MAPRRDGTVRAILGPTNTGKTYLAIERLCAHSSGVIGFPRIAIGSGRRSTDAKVEGPAERAKLRDQPTATGASAPTGGRMSETDGS